MARRGKSRPRPLAADALGGRERYERQTEALREAGVGEEDIQRRDAVLEQLRGGRRAAALRALEEIESPELKRGLAALVTPPR